MFTRSRLPIDVLEIDGAYFHCGEPLSTLEDSILTRELLRRLGAASFLNGENGFSYGRLHALEQCAALAAEARFHRAWKKFHSASLKT